MIHLNKVTSENVHELLRLDVKDEQRSFVASNNESIIEAYLALAHGGHAFPFGIYDDGTPVGFLMIGYGTDDEWEDAPSIADSNYNIWRLMIDKHYQHRGYGRQALKLALGFLRTLPCGSARYCYLSYEPDNIAAKALYGSFGFFETGEKDGDEIIAVLEMDDIPEPYLTAYHNCIIHH